MWHLGSSTRFSEGSAEERRGRSRWRWLLLGLLLALALVAMGCDDSSPTEPGIRADFTFSGEGPDVKFTDNSSGPILIWYWEFGDGDSSIDRSPTHTYFVDDLPRTYTVSLEVCSSSQPNESDCSKVSKSIRVFVDGPPA
jgi:PKD repeat protein